MEYIVLAIMILIVDIMTKLVVELNFGQGDSLAIIKDVFHFTYVENEGIAFGMFQGGRWIFVVLSILIMVLLSMVYSKTQYRSRWLKIGTAFVYGGALGNMIERMAKGYVTDFLDFRLINFPVFNVADIAICAGAVMLVIHFLFFDRPKPEVVSEGDSTSELCGEGDDNAGGDKADCGQGDRSEA